MTNTLSTLAVLLTALAPAAGSDDAIPGRDGNYEFDAISLVGTVWEGKLVYDDTSIIRFDANGVLRIRYFNQNTIQANWRQQGDRLIIEINNKYVECEGLVRNNRLVGSAKNRAPTNWKWELTRKPASAGNIFGAMK